MLITDITTRTLLSLSPFFLITALFARPHRISPNCNDCFSSGGCTAACICIAAYTNSMQMMCRKSNCNQPGCEARAVPFDRSPLEFTELDCSGERELAKYKEDIQKMKMTQRETPNEFCDCI